MNTRSQSRQLAAGSILALSLVLAGCAGEGTASIGLEASVDTIGGIERFHYPESGATNLPWRFDTVAVIGGFGVDDPNYQFAQIGRNGLAADAAGNLYVFDGQGKRILGYSPTGEFIGSWGREGEGPGEIGAWGGVLTVGAGDTLWLADASNQRITLFPTDGGDPVTIPMTDSDNRMAGQMLAIDGGVLSLMSSFMFTPGEEAQFPPRPLVTISRDGAIQDTVWEAPAPKTDLVEITTGNRAMVMLMTRRFSPPFTFGRFSDGGLVLQDQTAYDIRLSGADGTVQRVIQRDPAPRLATEEDRQRIIDQIYERADDPESDVVKKQAEATTFEDSVPRINRLIVDHADRVWVGVSETLPGEDERLDVFSRDGQLLGELAGYELPDLFFGDGYAAVLTEDELEVEQIVILRLVESP